MRIPAILALIAAMPAAAQSEAIPWGENPAQVAARRPGTGAVVAGKPGDAVFNQAYRARARGQLGDASVEEQFFFDEGDRLTVIKLLPLKSMSCDAFAAVARTEFGEPDVRERKVITGSYAVNRAVWRKREADRVMLLAEFPRFGSMDASCHVTIQPYGDGKPGVRDRQ